MPNHRDEPHFTITEDTMPVANCVLCHARSPETKLYRVTAEDGGNSPSNLLLCDSCLRQLTSSLLRFVFNVLEGITGNITGTFNAKT